MWKHVVKKKVLYISLLFLLSIYCINTSLVLISVSALLSHSRHTRDLKSSWYQRLMQNRKQNRYIAFISSCTASVIDHVLHARYYVRNSANINFTACAQLPYSHIAYTGWYGKNWELAKQACFTRQLWLFQRYQNCDGYIRATKISSDSVVLALYNYYNWIVL